MCRYSHNSSCSVAGQYIFADPYRYSLICKRIDSIRACEYAGYSFYFALAFSFRPFGHIFQIICYFLFLLRGCQRFYIFAFGCQYHKTYSIYGIRTGGEDFQLHVRIFDIKRNVSTLRAADPVALNVFQRIRPFQLLKAIQ